MKWSTKFIIWTASAIISWRKKLEAVTVLGILEENNAKIVYVLELGEIFLSKTIFFLNCDTFS